MADSLNYGVPPTSEPDPPSAARVPFLLAALLAVLGGVCFVVGCPFLFISGRVAMTLWAVGGTLTFVGAPVALLIAAERRNRSRRIK